MAGLMHDRDVIGRCPVQGHGQDCIVSQEIQSPVDRAYEKREIAREINEQLEDITDGEASA